MTFNYQTWPSTTKHDLQLPNMTFNYQTWPSTTKHDLQLPNMTFVYQTWPSTTTEQQFLKLSHTKSFLDIQLSSWVASYSMVSVMTAPLPPIPSTELIHLPVSFIRALPKFPINCIPTPSKAQEPSLTRITKVDSWPPRPKLDKARSAWSILRCVLLSPICPAQL